VFLSVRQDEVRQQKDFTSALRRVEELGFIRKFADNPEAWEIRRILKARLPVTELEALKRQLAASVTAAAAEPGRSEHNG
jgi:hypothetical protein